MRCRPRGLAVPSIHVRSTDNAVGDWPRRRARLGARNGTVVVRVDMAGGRPGAPWLLGWCGRVRRRSASRDRRGARGICSDSRSGRGRGDVRRRRADERPDGDDRRPRREGLAHPPGHAARPPRRRRLGGRRPCRAWPNRRGRARRSIRPPGRPRRPRRVVRRPAHPPSASARLPPSPGARGAARTTPCTGTLPASVGRAREPRGGHAARPPAPGSVDEAGAGPTADAPPGSTTSATDETGGGVQIGSLRVRGTARPMMRSNRLAAIASPAGATARAHERGRAPFVVVRRPPPRRAVPSSVRGPRAAVSREPRTPASAVAVRPGDDHRGARASSHAEAVRPNADRRWAVLAVVVAALVAAAAACTLGARRVAPKGLPIIGARERAGNSEEDLGRRGVAVCQRPPAHRPCRRLRRPVGHVRALSPAPRERRPDGQRNGRTRHAGHGRGGRGGRVTA